MNNKIIDISDEQSFKFCYILIRGLFTKYFPDNYLKKTKGTEAILETFHEKRTGISIEEFAKKIAWESQKEFQSKSDRIGESTVKDIVKRLSGDGRDNSNKENPNNFEKDKLKVLCRLLGFDSWENFAQNDQNKTDVKGISKSQLSNIDSIRNAKKIKIFFSILEDTYNGNQIEFQQNLMRIFRFRLTGGDLEGRVELEFDKNEKKIRNEEEALEKSKERYADLIIWGYFPLEHSGLKGKLNYLIYRPQLKKRIAHNKGGYVLMPIELNQLRLGEVYQKIDHLVLLILGISSLLEDQVEVAKNFLNRIPVSDWCDETFFVLGNCHYLAGEREKGLGLWQQAIKKNPKHLRAKINVARHQLSLMLRKGSLSEETVHNVKESLKDYDPKDATNEESALIGVLFAELGDTKKAIKALEAALRGNKKLEEASYYHIRLGQLKEDATESVEEYVKAALVTEQPELQELCFRLIADCRLSEVDEKRRLLAKIRDKSELNGERRRMNIEDWLSKSGKDVSASNDFIVYDICSHLRKNQSKELLKNGDGLNFDDWVLAENNAAKAVLLKCNNQGVASPIKRLYLKPGSAKKVEETLYEYAQPLRSSDSDDEILLMCSRELNHGKISGSERIKVVCQEIGLDLNLTFDDVGRLMLDRRMFDPFSGQMARKFTPIEIQQGSKTGVFTTIRKLRLLIPDDDEVGERVDRFSELIDISDNKYYSQLAGYLSDFYAPADETDIKLWSVARQLSWME